MVKPGHIYWKWCRFCRSRWWSCSKLDIYIEKGVGSVGRGQGQSRKLEILLLKQLYYINIKLILICKIYIYWKWCRLCRSRWWTWSKLDIYIEKGVGSVGRGQGQSRKLEILLLKQLYCINIKLILICKRYIYWKGCRLCRSRWWSR